MLMRVMFVFLLVLILVTDVYAYSLLGTSSFSLRALIVSVTYLYASIVIAYLTKRLNQYGMWLVLGILLFLNLFPAILVLVYATAFDISFLSLNDVLGPIFQSNFKETVEFLFQYKLLYSVVVFTVCFVFALVVIGGTIKRHRFTGKKEIVLSVLCLVVLVILSREIEDNHRITKKPLFMHFLDYGLSYKTELENFMKVQNGYKFSNDIDARISNSDANQPNIHVLVIGESLSRDYMSLYGYGLNTTPKLTEIRDDIIVYNNAHSNHTHTEQALTLALTEANQYNDKKYNSSASIVQVANIAGYDTLWVTNQALFGKFENKVSVIAKISKKVKGLNSLFDTTRTTTHDGRVFSVVKDAIDQAKLQNKDTIIFAHLMGSHGHYCQRYPSSFEVYDDIELSRDVNCYNNSVVYNDYLISGLVEFIRDKNIKGTLTYLSDHGEDPESGFGHNSQKLTPPMHRVPLIFYTSTQWEQQNASKFKALKENSNKIVTNDLLFNVVLDLWNIETEGVERNTVYSLANEKFEIKKPTTLHGKISLN